MVSQIDITERKDRELAEHAQARTDSLTGLTNRLGIQERLAELAEAAVAFSVLYLDLDGFKLINDTFGHSVGDLLLMRVASHLLDLCRTPNVVARIGGDEFIVVLMNGDIENAQRFANELIEAVSEPYTVAGIGNLSISASVGIARFPLHSDSVDELVAHADTAMYVAKGRGRKRFALYEPSMYDTVRRRTLVVQSLYASLKADEITTAYQPIIDARSGSIWAVEALLRWDHPELGEVSPKECVAAAEEAGLIGELEIAVWRVALADYARMRAQSEAAFLLTLNVSARHVIQDSFVAQLSACLAKENVSPAEVVLELTETAMMSTLEIGFAPFARLAEMGFCIAIDDFGTGYSSLAYLHDLPAKVIKIDGSFVARIEQETSTLRFISELGRAQGRLVVAEGVETPSQLAAVRKLDVSLLQGFMVAHPCSAAELLRSLASVNDGSESH